MTALPIAPAIYWKLRRKGVVFWLDEGRTRYSGPPGAVTPNCIAQLRDEREKLLAYVTALDNDVGLRVALGICG